MSAIRKTSKIANFVSDSVGSIGIIIGVGEHTLTVEWLYESLAEAAYHHADKITTYPKSHYKVFRYNFMKFYANFNDDPNAFSASRRKVQPTKLNTKVD